MLICDKCKQPFNTTDRQPYTSNICGHTFCKKCLLPLSQRDFYCQFCSISHTDKKKSDTVPKINKNFKLMEVVEYFQENPIIDTKHFIAERHILTLPTYCSIHKSTIINYNIDSDLFFCRFCPKTIGFVYTIKEIIEVKQQKIETDKKHIKELHASLEHIKKLATTCKMTTNLYAQSLAYNSIYEHINNSIELNRDNNIETLRLLFEKLLTIPPCDTNRLLQKVERLEIQYEHIKETNMYNDRKCSKLIELDFDYSKLFELNIHFKKNIDTTSLSPQFNEIKRDIADCEDKIKNSFKQLTSEISKYEFASDKKIKIIEVVEEYYTHNIKSLFSCIKDN